MGQRSFFPTGALRGLIIGAVLVPAVLSISVGIVALALWRQAFDIVFGVLVLSFAAMSAAGAVAAILFLRRSARLAELQTEFIANVSHELRTPLAGVRLMVETLSRGRAGEPAVQQEVLQRLAVESRRLEELVERILTWRRFEGGAFPRRGEPLRVEALVETAIDALNGPLDGGGTPPVIETAVEEALPLVRGDRSALVDALRNLLENAVKFSHGAPVRVELGRAGRGVRIAVRDRGPGIPESEQSRIFERFYRLPRDQQTRGTGLGLAIVRRVADQHGGAVSVRSEPGDGATFEIELPADAEGPRA